MESFLGALGGFGILVLLVIAGVVVYLLIFNKIKPGNETKQPKLMGVTKCPICGGKMQSIRDAPHIMRCTTPKCPNN
jgi:hypothetical protein